MKKVFQAVKQYLLKANEDYVTIHAAYSALFLFVSVFPLIMFILYLLATMNVSRTYLTAQLLRIAPESFHGLITDIIENIAENSTGFVMSLSVILAVWTSSSGTFGMMIGLNDVYRTYDTRPYVLRRFLAILYTFLFVFIVGISLLLLVLGNRLSEVILFKFPKTAGLVGFIRYLRYPFALLLFILFFLVIYRFFPKRKTKLFWHLPGALFASVGWSVLSYVYSVYVDHFPQAAMYGSLAMVVLFLFWLWIGMLIVFLGGEINAMLIDRREGTETSEIRVKNLEKIRKREAELKKTGRFKLGDHLNLRKATSRKAGLNEIKAEMKEKDGKKEP